MGNTDQKLKSRKIVFDQKSRDSYFDKLNQALKSLSVVADYKERSMRTAKGRVDHLEKTSVQDNYKI